MTTSHASLNRESIVRLLLVIGLVALVVLAYRETFATMAGFWNRFSYRHAYVVAPISLWLLWRSRHELAAKPVDGSWVGVGALLLLLAGWLVARAAGVQALEQVLAVLMISALVLAALGRSAYAVVAFALAFLLGTVPVGEELTPYLVAATSDGAEWLLHVTAIPYLREGTFFTLPGGSFEVADVCSGLRYLLAGVLVSALFAYLNYRGWGKRILFVAIAVVLFLAFNWLRAYLVMAVSSATEGRWLTGESHIRFGEVLFGIAVIAMFWIGAKYADTPLDRKVPEVDPAARGDRWRRAGVLGAVGVAILLAGPLLQAQRHAAAGRLDASLSLPALTGCTGPADWASPWRPSFAGADAETSGSFVCDGRQVDAFVAAYGYQEQGKELISAGNVVLPADWRRVTTKGTDTFEAAGRRIAVNEATIALPDRRVLVWYWYDVNGRPLLTGPQVKLREALAGLAPGPSVSSVHVVAVTDAGDDPGATRAAAEQAARALLDTRVALHRDRDRG